MDKTPLKLVYPVTDNGTEYTELSIARPKVKDLLNAEAQCGSGDDAESPREAYVFAHLAGVPLDVIRAMDMADYRAFQDIYRGFMKPSPKDPPLDG